MSRYKRGSLFSGATDKERRWFLDKGDVVGDLGAGSFSLDKKGCLVLGVKEGADGGLGGRVSEVAPVSSFRREVRVLERADAGRGLWCQRPARGFFDLIFESDWRE